MDFHIDLQSGRECERFMALKGEFIANVCVRDDGASHVALAISAETDEDGNVIMAVYDSYRERMIFWKKYESGKKAVA
jgi:hypothetical protein